MPQNHSYTNTKHGSYCVLLRCRCGFGWAPGRQRSLRTCGMLGAKWARSWAAYWALWRRRIVTSRRPRPFFLSIFFFQNLTGFFFFPRRAVLHIHSPRSSPRQTGELGLSAWLATSPPPFVSKWFNISFVLNHICRPRPTPSWVSEVTLFPPSEIFDIMQDGRCNYNKDLWQRLSRPPTDACRSAWWHHHSFTQQTYLKCPQRAFTHCVFHPHDFIQLIWKYISP